MEKYSWQIGLEEVISNNLVDYTRNALKEKGSVAVAASTPLEVNHNLNLSALLKPM
jgi:hypothetical protein